MHTHTHTQASEQRDGKDLSIATIHTNMEAKVGLVAGSHNSNEFIIFNQDANFSVSIMLHLNI